MKQRTYKGKYPNRIKQIESTRTLSVLLVTTNNGQRYTIRAVDTNGVMPQLGAEIGAYIAAKRLDKAAEGIQV